MPSTPEMERTPRLASGRCGLMTRVRIRDCVPSEPGSGPEPPSRTSPILTLTPSRAGSGRPGGRSNGSAPRSVKATRRPAWVYGSSHDPGQPPEPRTGGEYLAGLSRGDQ